MGVTYYSEAVIFTIEPEKIKNLIGQVYDLEPNNHGYCHLYLDSVCAASTLCDLEIIENAITFNSGSYGFFGLDEYCDIEELLFKYLFDNFDGPLVCHESVRDCNNQDVFYSSTWVKQEGEVDYDSGEFACNHAAGKTLNDDPDLYSYWVWSTRLEDRWITPSAKQLIEAVKAKGFQDWATKEELEEHYNADESITVDTIWKIAEEYEELEDLASDAVNEAENMMFEFNKFIGHLEDYPEELEDFVEKHNNSVEKMLACCD